MKLLIRTFSLTIVLLLLIMLVIRFNNYNYIINEYHNASYLAIEESMNKEMKYLSGEMDNIDLEEEVLLSFKNLVSNNNLYNVDVKANKDLGIIKLEVKPKYLKNVRTINLTNIIEHYLEVNDKDGMDQFDVKEFRTKVRQDNVLYHKEFEEPVLLKSFYIDIEGYPTTNVTSKLNYYEPEMIIDLIDENDKKIIYRKPAVPGKAVFDEINFDSDDYDFEEMYVKSVKLEMKAIAKNVAPKVDMIRIGSTNKNYFEYEGEKEEVHTIYSRYVDRNYKPDTKSLWNTKTYRDTLNSYLQ